MEYNFYKELDGKHVKVDGKLFQYKIVSSFNEIGETIDNRVKTIFVILTIEGAHVFNTGLQMMGKKANPAKVLANVDTVKKAAPSNRSTTRRESETENTPARTSRTPN